ncbi:class I SAM-dependent methyltransferase [Deinococcus sp. KNUC1210]|uniref:class I SAM-dependent methyltransferase n=1 Tax=Deinococcus sp. KNUC1210 TaxID=2917691 RepID=UPI001EEF8908|nr:class I SAM-dependent methyltransferase [Deinococcus sp. KNUC1210]ULH16335.1 class I SAM-dependent methyltransferase [Deinococcus sp. KNUC1210]
MNPAQRDDLLSRRCGQVWPFGVLLNVVPVRETATVLDIGGGDGRCFSELARRGHSGQRALIDAARGGDAHALPFPAQSFDVVLMLRVLAHLHTPALALAEARRVLRPGGRLVVAAHGPLHLAALFGPVPAQRSPELPAAVSFDLRLPVCLTVRDQRALLASYGQRAQPEGELKTELQLCGWTEQSEQRN